MPNATDPAPVPQVIVKVVGWDRRFSTANDILGHGAAALRGPHRHPGNSDLFASRVEIRVKDSAPDGCPTTAEITTFYAPYLMVLTADSPPA